MQTEIEQDVNPVSANHLGKLRVRHRRGFHPAIGEGFEPLAAMQTVQAERCTALYGVPTMFIGELDHPRFSEFDFSSLR